MSAPSAQTLKGTVRSVFADKAFGFIRVQTPGLAPTDYFFHATATIPDGLFRELKEGDAVAFEIGTSHKGPRAEQVRRA